MSLRTSVVFALAAGMFLITSYTKPVRAQEKPPAAKSFRCTFPLIATATWNKEGTPDGAMKSAGLILRFDAINVDEGTAELKNGTVSTGVTVQSAGGNLHFVQAFRSGPLYVTTIFGKEIRPGKFKAVHSRHELFSVPLDGATSSPEQYYGECDIVS